MRLKPYPTRVLENTEPTILQATIKRVFRRYRKKGKAKIARR
jgi:hypothetical protein